MASKIRPVLLGLGAFLFPALFVVGVALFVHSEGLDRANMWSGVVSMIIGLVGLVLAILGLRGRQESSTFNIKDCEEVINQPGDISISRVIHHGRVYPPDEPQSETDTSQE